MNTIGFMLIVLVLLFFISPELILIAFVVGVAILDAIAFMITGKHWLD